MMNSTEVTGQDDAVARRLLPERAFPPYTHIPGATPHPIGDPAGHSHGRKEPPCPRPDSDVWSACEPFAWGVDLFNAGYYWEAHEAWEGVWIAAGRSGPTADFLKGLIKLAAGGVKVREQNLTGARRHLRRAAELFAGLETKDGSGSGRMFGLSIDELRVVAERWLHGALSTAAERDGHPVRVFDLELRPAAA